MHDTAAVADSGPMICLARINQLELLPRLFSRILMPPEVWEEAAVRGQGHPGADEIIQVQWNSGDMILNSLYVIPLLRKTTWPG